MFSKKLRQYADETFAGRIEYYGSILSGIEEKIQTCTEDEEVLMRFLYGTMAVRDAGEYDFSIFLEYVRHAIYLREYVTWCKELPEDIFVNYVLYDRINSEDISVCRSFFYEQLIDRIQGLSLSEAVIEINYWCAEHATYETTDGRTVSPMTMYRCGKGRCGEESTFAVSAFRSVGIAARQVYTPRWAHCDDNHAWVEVYVDGEWHFLGACEPQEVLDTGWFSGPANRAILIHARNFSNYTGENGEEQIGQEGSLYYYNHTSFYAKTRKMLFTVKDEENNPVTDAHIAVEVLNMAEFFPIVTLNTDDSGSAAITLGIGDVHLRVWKDDVCVEQMVKVAEGTEIAVILSKERSCFGKEQDAWQCFEIEAPKEEPIRNIRETKEQKEKNAKRLKEAEEARTAYVESFYDKQKAASYEAEQEILHRAGANFHEIYEFLSKDDNPNRKRLLHSLSVKDAKDARADILEDHLDCVQGTLPDELFEKYVLCPRIDVEELTAYRSYIRGYFEKETLEAFAADPMQIQKYISSHMAYHGEVEYGTILATPVGALRMGQGSERSRHVLFVAICRTIMVPARLNPVTRLPEYYADGVFHTVIEETEDAVRPCGTVVLKAKEESEWRYYQTWTIGKQKGVHFETLNYENIICPKTGLELKLQTGTYRLITTIRMPDGNQRAAALTFTLAEGQKKEIILHTISPNIQENLEKKELPDIHLYRQDETKVQLSELCSEKTVLLAFLGVGGEPTEHVLNELCELADQWNEKKAQILCVVRGSADFENKTLQKAKNAVSGMELFLAGEEEAKQYAQIMGLDGEKLPLLVLVRQGLLGTKSYAGYNVGSVAMMLRLMDEIKKA